jgi:tetratricopeptide (TPR) repeat protein
LLSLGYIEQFSHPDQATRCFTEAKEKAENIKNFALLSDAYNFLANFYFKFEQYDLAIQYIQEQISLINEKNLNQTPPYGLVGGIYAKQEKTDLASRSINT